MRLRDVWPGGGVRALTDAAGPMTRRVTDDAGPVGPGAPSLSGMM